jgi:hypothetical protein
MAETAHFPPLQSAVTIRTTPMKKLLTLTAALLITGAAFAATAPAGSAAPTATPATRAQPAQKHNSAMHCEKQAKEKKLTGDAEKEFVKDCREGKKAN